MATQLYTVKRIPRRGRPTEFDFQILGPGAPPKPFASGAIASMVREHLERAGQALTEQFESKTGGGK